MKKNLLGLLIILGLMISGCGNAAVDELNKNDTNKAQAKVEPTATEPTQELPKEEEKVDIWTYYNDAKWSENFEGLKMEIQKVVVSDKGDLAFPDEPEYKSLVGIKFKMENTTQTVFNAYPDQALLVTSTGEQIDGPSMMLSEHIGGEIHEGVIKEGNIIWPLERGHAEDIKWIKLEWSAHTEGDNSKRKEFSVKIDLKK